MLLDVLITKEVPHAGHKSSRGIIVIALAGAASAAMRIAKTMLPTKHIRSNKVRRVCFEAAVAQKSIDL